MCTKNWRSLQTIIMNYMLPLKFKVRLGKSSFAGFLLPKMARKHVESLKAPITNEENISATDSLKSNKSPGRDRLMAEFYKKN